MESAEQSAWRSPIRPLRLGILVGHPLGSTGSMGPFVRFRDGAVGFLSTQDVLAPRGARTTDYVHQPGPADVELLTGETRVGTLAAFHRATRDKTNRVSVAAVAVDPSIVGRNVAPEGCSDAGKAITGLALDMCAGDEIAFAGRSSGCRVGHVSAIEMDNLSVWSSYEEALTFSGLIEARAASGVFSEPGDAGALVWRRSDMAALGFVFAANVDVTYILPLGPALEAVKASLI